MPQKFIACDRDQDFLMPPSLRDWIAKGNLVWTILGAVDEMDLSLFYGAYRADGHGRPAYEPSMMVALLLYAYARGNRSSRGIERECSQDIAYRVITTNRVPDHSTIADFRKRHEAALSELFGEVLVLCREAGLVQVGVIAVDGTKVHANASNMANRDYRQIAMEILAEAARINREEDELYGDARGDELPEQLRTAEGRKAALREAKRAFRGYVQGYNAQAVVTEQQIVIAAEVNVEPQDFGHLGPMVAAAQAELANAGIAEQPDVVVADAGYWHSQQMDELAARGIAVLIPPDKTGRKTARPGWHGGRYSWMRRLLASDVGRELYDKRHKVIEPVFGQIKFNRKIDRFQRRGRGAARSEWRLAAATHNLLKLHHHRIAATGA